MKHVYGDLTNQDRKNHVKVPNKSLTVGEKVRIVDPKDQSEATAKVVHIDGGYAYLEVRWEKLTSSDDTVEG